MKKYKSAKAAVLDDLLNGEKINSLNCFIRYGITNCAKEVKRMVETPFGVALKKEDSSFQTNQGLTINLSSFSMPKISKAKREEIEAYINAKTETNVNTA